jgi:membrane protein
MRRYVKPVRGAFERWHRFASHDVWRLGRPGEKLPDSFLAKQARVAILLFGNFIQDALLLRSAALSFATVLFLVPFLIFMFAMIQAFNLGERVYAMWSDELEARLTQVTELVVGTPRPDDEPPAAAPDDAWDMAEAAQPGLSPPLDDGAAIFAEEAPDGVDDVSADAIEAAVEEEVSEKGHELLMALLHQMIPDLPGDAGDAGELENPVEILVRYAEQAASPGALGIMGVWFVLTTVFGLMRNVEDAFQRIWGIKETRSWFYMISTYLLVALIVPFVAAGALGINAALGSEAVGRQLGPFSFLLRVVQYTMIWLAFSVIYYFVPNTKVSVRYALLSGVVAGTLWNVTAWGFWKFQFGLARGTLLYSSLALVPVLLMWIYVSWMILLLGAELTFAYQNEKTFALERFADKANYAYREAVGFCAMLEIARRFDEGEDGLLSEQSAHAWNVPTRLLNDTLAHLKEEGLVSACATEPVTYQPARSLDRIRVGDVVRALREAGQDPSLLREDEKFRPLLEQLHNENEFLNMTMRELLDRMRTVDAELMKDITTSGEERPNVRSRPSISMGT